MGLFPSIPLQLSGTRSLHSHYRMLVLKPDPQSKKKERKRKIRTVFDQKLCLLQALVECEGDSIDLSGDMGAVGRVVISDAPSGNHDMYLDLKGRFC
jgi:hypothetical protein